MQANSNNHIVYAILGINDKRYVDKIIKLMENVPELLVMIGFLKSFFISAGYKITFKIIKIKNITPKLPNRSLKVG